MRAFLLRRFFSMAVTLLVASAVVFGLLRMIPGDPADLLLKHATPEKKAELNSKLGLDRPLVVQYSIWIGNAVRGSFGESFRTQREVATDLVRHWPATVELALAAMMIAVVVGIPLGVWAAARRGTWADAMATTVSLAGLSTPIFWLGLMASLVFSLWLGWLPSSGRLDDQFNVEAVTGFLVLDALGRGDFGALTNAVWHLILPAAVLATVPAAYLARITRSAVADAMEMEFVRAARAKGASEAAVVWRHALRAAGGPIATMGNVQLSYLIGGAVLTETVFSWPGLGRYLTEAILSRDYPAVQGALIVVVACVVVLNFVGDLIHARLEPRIQMTDDQ